MGLFLTLACPTAAWGLALNTPRTGSFLGPDGSRLKVDPIYIEHFRPHPTRHLRHLAWQVGILGAGTIWYWANLQANSSDWEFSGDDFANRFSLDAIRFDNNHFTINHLAHPSAGAGYYTAARIHGHGISTSVLISVGMSALWEAGLEWRERISINDMMFTPGAGIAMGEAYFRLSHYLNSAPGGGTWVHKALGWTLGFPVAINRWIDDVPPVDDDFTDSLGFSGAYHHRFRLAYQTIPADGLHGFRIESKMIAVPGFQRPGKFEILFDDGNFTHFDISVFYQNGESAQLNLWFESALRGYYEQDFTGLPGQLTGTAALFTLSFAFEHVQRWLPQPQDRRAILHLPGVRLAVWNAWHGWMHSLQINIHPDFSSIDSLAFPVWKAANPTKLERSVLEDRGYYYGWGGTTWIISALRYRRFDFNAKLRFSYINSIEGSDRHQEEITSEGSFKDTVVEYRASLGYTDPYWLLSPRIEAWRIERQGSRSGGTAQTRTWNQLAFSLGTAF